MSLPQRRVHASGATRVCIDGAHLLTGGADGVVSLYALRRFPNAPPLWARQCHDGVVTSVVLHSAFALAVSCGRDGKVILHENVMSADETLSTSRVVCRVTGELRCLLFDAARRRVFIAGDSLRALRMDGGRFDICTIPLAVPHPLVALALSPCGNLLAMASASGAVGVWPVGGGEGAARWEALRVAAPSLLSSAAKREDAAAFRLVWCRHGGGKEAALSLVVPGVAEARVWRLEESPQPRLRHVGTMDGLGLTDLRGVACHGLSAHVWCAVLFSKSGFVVARVDTRNWTMTRLKGENFSAAAVTDGFVDTETGDVAIGTADGMVTCLRKEAPRALRVKSHTTDMTKPQDGENPDTSGESKPKTGNQSTNEVGDGTRRRSSHDENSNSNSNTQNKSNDSHSDEDSGDASSSSSVASIEQEDLGRVVHDLKRENPAFVEDDDEERPSRWRREGPSEALRVARAEEKRQPMRSAFLDDEAEESSEDGDEDEDHEGDRGHSYEDAEERNADYNPRGGGGGGGGGGGSSSYNNNNNAHGKNGREANNYDDAASLATSGQPDGSSFSGAVEKEPHGSPGGVLRAVSDYSFQICATPAGEESSCYLAYNSVGYIHCTPEGTTIHFHDMSVQTVRILEKGTILMAALSPVGATFVIAQDMATDNAMDSVDDLPRLTVYYRTFVAIGAQSEWRVRLHPGETVRCMTAGIRYTAVATNRYLRLFSLSGLELAVLSLFPRIVAMVGTNSSKLMHSFKADFDPLAVCYLDGGELKAQVLDVGSRAVVVSPCTVPLTEATDGSTHQLQWMGWSEDGPLHVVDTAGVLRMLTLDWGGGWVPVFDPRVLSDQTYNLWIWGVSDESLLAYRSPKSDPPYPAAVASGLPTERLRLFLPLVRNGAEREMVTWDHILRREIRADEVKRRSNFYTPAIAKFDALHDKKIMELFSHAVKEQQTTRALDLATYLELRDNIELCAREANAQGQVQLVHKLLALLEVRVKAKRKRKCPLPLEGSVVSERERDLLLRRLLAKEKEGTPRVENGTAATTTNAVENATHKEQSATVTQGVYAREKNDEATPQQRNPRQSSPSAPSPSKRRVTFTDAAPTLVETRVTPPRSTAMPTTPTPAAPKQTTPQAKPNSQSHPTPNSIAAKSHWTPTTTTTSARAGPAKSVNPFSRPQKTTMDLSAPTLVLGESQSSQPHAFPSAKHDTPSPEKEAAAAREPSSAVSDPSPTRRAFHPFCPKAPSTRAVLGETPPVDPFLDKSDGATLETLLVDVGHAETTPSTAPRSASFADALRKRYRDEDDEDDEEEGGDEAKTGDTRSVIPRLEIR